MNLSTKHTHTSKRYKEKLSLIFLVLLPTLFISCQKDLLLEKDTDAGIYSKSGGISVIEGRLYFPNNESLGEVFTSYADASESELYYYMQEFYDNGFFSLRPPVYEGNEDAIVTQYEERVATFFDKYGSIMETEVIYEKIDDTQFVIGSDVFAAFLNENSEIHVGSKIYKYTDVGLFMVDDEAYEELINFLSDRNISDNLIINTTSEALDSFSTEVIGRGFSQLTDNISFFVFRCGFLDPNITDPFAPADPGLPINEPCGGSGGGGSGGGGNQNNVPSLDGLQEFVDGLPLCRVRNGVFGSLFGDNNVCIDKYESRRRVKTKAFNYNYFLVFHTGVKVKHQFKGWTGIWRREKTDVVAVGVEMVQFEYDYSSVITHGLPNINPLSVNYSVKPINFTYNVGTDIWSDKYGNQNYNLWNTYIWTPNLPPIFHDDLIIEAYNMNYKLLSSQELNNHFWNSVWNSAENQLKSITNDSNWENPLNATLLSNYPNMGKIHVQKCYFSHCYNCSKTNKTFAFDGAFTLRIGYNPTSGTFTYGGGQGQLVAPQSFRIKMYGAAKKGGQWHGSKLYFRVD